MGKKLSPKDQELYKATDEVLHYIWDPVGVAGVPYARDEYWGYLPRVFSMLKSNEAKETIINYLLTIEEENMGISKSREKAEEVVEILFEHKDKIDEEHP